MREIKTLIRKVLPFPY